MTLKRWVPVYEQDLFIAGCLKEIRNTYRLTEGVPDSEIYSHIYMSAEVHTTGKHNGYNPYADYCEKLYREYPRLPWWITQHTFLHGGVKTEGTSPFLVREGLADAES